MLPAPLRWITDNLSTFILAFVLSLVVWVSAVVTADPNEERVYLRPLTVIGQDRGLSAMDALPDQVRITVRAPRSILSELTNNNGELQAWIDLSGLDAGSHRVPVKVSWKVTPVQLVRVEPQVFTINLESIVTHVLPVQLMVNGDPPLGYKKGQPAYKPEQVTVSGPESMVNKVKSVRASLNLAGQTESINLTLPIEAVNQDGDRVTNVTIDPKSISVTQPIQLLGGYKNAVVRVVTKGQVSDGYRLTNISVTPPNVILFSADPQVINAVPGYIQTMPVDLNQLTDDQDFHVALNLPANISLVGEQSVLVQVGVAAMEGSLRLSLPIEALGLPPELLARIAPASVDIIVSGPLPVLDGLTPASFRAVIDLAGLNQGSYQKSPIVDLSPAQVTVQTILPETVQVEIAPVPTSTPTPLRSLRTPTPFNITPSPTVTTRRSTRIISTKTPTPGAN